MDSVDPRGNTPRPSSAKGIIGNYLPVSHSKSNNLDMFALEANVLFIAKQVCTLFLLFRSCSNKVKPQQLEPWYIEASPYMSNRIYNTLDSE